MQRSAPVAQRIPDQPCIDCLDESAAAGRRPATARAVAFWLLAAVLTCVMLGTTLPTPLYVIYQAQWHFSAVLVTVIFAVYAVAVLAALLFAGRSSDQAGRKPVLAVALGCSALSTIVFILAPDVGLLFVGRILSGLSAGLTTGTATAALTELAPASAGRRASLVATAANMGGLGLGPLIAGLFAQYAPNPTVLVFEVYLAVRVMLAGLSLFLAGLALITAALSAASMALFLTGTIVTGIAVGAVFLGSLATANRLAPPGRRGQVVSTYFVACYCGLIVPVVGVGVLSEFVSDFTAVLALSIVLAVLSVFALNGIRRAL